MAKVKQTSSGNSEVADFLGNLVSFRDSLKLVHWSVTGLGSYEVHLSIDQAIDTFNEVADRLVETTFALLGTLEVVVPETKRPKDYIKHVKDQYDYIEKERKIFKEDFSQSIIDDYQEGIQQLLFRLKRLE
ncbi:MAG: hypothetical protein PW786_15210 [Arachidicoccus sp.]|nr:hypothetical protein [Arachidicoccus sp.]